MLVPNGVQHTAEFLAVVGRRVKPLPLPWHRHRLHTCYASLGFLLKAVGPLRCNGPQNHRVSITHCPGVVHRSSAAIKDSRWRQSTMCTHHFLVLLSPHECRRMYPLTCARSLRDEPNQPQKALLAGRSEVPRGTIYRRRYFFSFPAPCALCFFFVLRSVLHLYVSVLCLCAMPLCRFAVLGAHAPLCSVCLHGLPC